VFATASAEEQETAGIGSVSKIGAERFSGDSELYSLPSLDEFNRSLMP
jgi:hypothetical protein